MAFFEQRFDERISYGARGGPMWNTSRVVTQSGWRAVNKNWRFPLHKFDVSHAVKTIADFEVVRAMFYNVAGAFDGFRFKDWSDFTLTQANSRIADGEGSPNEWQIYRVYTVGAREFLRPIYKPNGDIVVNRTRASVVSTATATVSTTTGLVVITGHQTGDTYTCTGTFDVPVAFADDAMQAELVDDGGDEYLMRWGSIVLEELRLSNA